MNERMANLAFELNLSGEVDDGKEHDADLEKSQKNDKYCNSLNEHLVVEFSYKNFCEFIWHEVKNHSIDRLLQLMIQSISKTFEKQTTRGSVTNLQKVK